MLAPHTAPGLRGSQRGIIPVDELDAATLDCADVVALEDCAEVVAPTVTLVLATLVLATLVLATLVLATLELVGPPLVDEGPLALDEGPFALDEGPSVVEGPLALEGPEAFVEVTPLPAPPSPPVPREEPWAQAERAAAKAMTSGRDFSKRIRSS